MVYADVVKFSTVPAKNLTSILVFKLFIALQASKFSYG